MGWPRHKVRKLVFGGRRDDVRLNGGQIPFSRSEEGGLAKLLTSLPLGAVVALLSFVFLLLLGLLWLGAIWPLEALNRTRQNTITDGFVGEYRNTVLGDNFWIALDCNGAAKRVRVSGVDVKEAAARALKAFPECHAYEGKRICRSRRLFCSSDAVKL